MARALRILEDLGMKAQEVVPTARDYAGIAKRIRAGEVVAAHERVIRDPVQLARVVDERQRKGLLAFLEEPLGSMLARFRSAPMPARK